METDELWCTGPQPWKTPQPGAHKRGTVLTPSLPPSPSHHPVTKEARGVLDSHNPSPLCRLVPLPPRTRTHMRTHIQTPARTHGASVSHPIPFVYPSAALTVLCTCTCACVRACSYCQNSSTGDGEDRTLSPSPSAQGEPPLLQDTNTRAGDLQKQQTDVTIAPEF